MDGLLLIDKPPGMSSHSAVAVVRRNLGVKAGHAGTLDPFATGLLLVLLGRATRVARFLSGLPKSYRVTARLGGLSSTGDPTGEITTTGRIPDPAATLPTGVISQRPPAYSAVHVGGERAYRRARRGEEFEMPEREVEVTRFERVSAVGDGTRATYEIDCSSGTYVRSLIADLADAYCEDLRRTRVGPFDVNAARAPDQAQAADLLSVADALAFMPRVEVAGQAGERLRHGRPVAMAPGSGWESGHVLATDGDGALAVCAVRALCGGLGLAPVVGLRG